MDKDPFANYVMKIKKVDRGYLTLQELTTIMQKNFTVKRLEQVRDVFVFQCYTGLAYCDTFKLTHANIIKDDNGVLWIKAKRIKTDTPINVPVLPIAAELISKYATEDTGKLLPVLSNQKMNAYLKEIADLCNIEKRLSCHLARHTFATTVTLANGISLESVSKMLGHTNLVTTKIYARMLDSRVLSEMQMLSSKLKSD
jgi:site-specific recombinase XerD